VQIGSAVGQGQIKIYVYPLPQLWQVCESAEVFAHIRATIYGAEQVQIIVLLSMGLLQWMSTARHQHCVP
jgi:hypothetical protein